MCYHIFKFIDRPKRTITKPSRYLTTSSDEDPPPQKRSTEGLATADCDLVTDDIEDIRRTLQDEDENENISLFHTDTHTAKRNTQSNTNIQTYTTEPLISHYIPHTHTQTHSTYTSYIQTPHIHMNTHSIPTAAQLPQHQTQTNFALTAEADQVLYTNSGLSQLQIPGKLPIQQDRGHQRRLHVGKGDVSHPQDIHHYGNIDTRYVYYHIYNIYFIDEVDYNTKIIVTHTLFHL